MPQLPSPPHLNRSMSSFFASNSSKAFLPCDINRRRNHFASKGLFKIPTLPKNPSRGTRIIKPYRFSPVCVKQTTDLSTQQEGFDGNLEVEVGAPKLLNFTPAMKLSLSDQGFFLLTFIACMTSVAFTSFVMAAVPTLYAMARAATSLSKLADTAREELPSTMAAVRLSGMEISDLTLELSDLSQEIADGVHKSTQAVQAAEAGIRQIGSLARQQTMSMIEERANLPVISLQPAVVGAAKKTSQAVGRATKSFMYFISRGELSSGDEDEDKGIDRLEL